MKKVICISVILALTIGAGIAEIVLSSNMFKELNLDLIALSESIEANEENVANDETIGKANAVLNKWNKGKNFALMLTNHSIMRGLDEKLVSLLSWVESGGYDDAKALCEVSIALTEDLIDETYPILSNLF